jgi:hypothetical protein
MAKGTEHDTYDLARVVDPRFHLTAGARGAARENADVRRRMKLWRGQPDNWTWKPSPGDMGRFWLGLAGVSYVLSFAAFASPSASSGTRRLAWLHRLSTNVFGPNGDVILFALLGTVCLLVGLVSFRRPK